MSASSGRRRRDWILSPEPSFTSGGPAAGPAIDGLALTGDFCEFRLVTAFHPELTDDTRLHELFIAMIRREGAVEPAGAAQPRAFGASGRAVAAPVNR